MVRVKLPRQDCSPVIHRALLLVLGRFSFAVCRNNTWGQGRGTCHPPGEFSVAPKCHRVDNGIAGGQRGGNLQSRCQGRRWERCWHLTPRHLGDRAWSRDAPALGGGGWTLRFGAQRSLPAAAVGFCLGLAPSFLHLRAGGLNFPCCAPRSST